ncbi:hypothetical protein VXS06_14390 [Photobacterium toruni]|uniref:Baseplate J-like protein n=1 Tax=Photobacterium toruni TaxID=1935446 RepID=A0ABU6LAA3_9GAMM|nr:hypothetical protein [Photobacterium toruni]
MSIKSVKQDLENAWKSNSYWKRFIGSQFANGLSEFIAQIVYRCNQYASRRLQESFLSKATLESSILAAAEDRAYIGLRITPSYGMAILTNKTNERVTLPVFAPLVSNDGINYVTTSSIDLIPGGTADIKIIQYKIDVKNIVVDEYKKWLTFTLPRETTTIANRVDVYVNGELWEKRFKFRNSNSVSKVYMEFYTSTRQLGIRFGNGITGAVPAKGDTVELRVWCTDGETTLLDNQPLALAGDLSVFNSKVSVKTKTTITGGAPAESIEDTRNGALYLTAYDHQLAWDGDYLQFIKTNIGGLIYLDVWGEQEEEELHGFNIKNINKIFITAYSDRKSDVNIKAEILELFRGREGYNENYEWKERVDAPFSLVISGKIFNYGLPAESESVIRSELVKKFGKDVKGKPSKVVIDDVWDFVHNLKDAANISEFTLSSNNITNTRAAGHYQFIDIEQCQIDFTYM